MRQHTRSNAPDASDSSGLIAPAVGHERPGSGALVWYKRFAQDEIALASRMSLQGFGANVKLRDQAWMQSPLPPDDASLARLLGCTVKEFRSIRAEALNGFVQDDAGLWHPKIEQERDDANGRRERTSHATEAWKQKAAERREKRNDERNGQRDGSSDEDRGGRRSGSRGEIRNGSAPASALAVMPNVGSPYGRTSADFGQKAGAK